MNVTLPDNKLDKKAKIVYILIISVCIISIILVILFSLVSLIVSKLTFSSLVYYLSLIISSMIGGIVGVGKSIKNKN